MKLAMVILALSLTTDLAAQEPLAVPFRLVDGWAILLEGTLGGVPNCKIMIDTGAVPSAINSKFVKRLGLAGSFQKLSVMNRSVDAQRLRVPGVRIGPVSVEALDVMAVDLGLIEQRLDTRIDAVIGLDFLGKRNFHLDYRRKKLVFDSHVDDTSAISFEMRHEAGGMYILIPLESGGQRLQILLDTGSKDLTLFDRRVTQMLQCFRVQPRCEFQRWRSGHVGSRGNGHHQRRLSLPEEAKSLFIDYARGKPARLRWHPWPRRSRRHRRRLRLRPPRRLIRDSLIS
jgi:hypothetical protein